MRKNLNRARPHCAESMRNLRMSPKEAILLHFIFETGSPGRSHKLPRGRI